MTEHTLAVIVLVLLCMNEVRGLYEKTKITPGAFLIGWPLSIFAAWLAFKVVF